MKDQNAPASFFFNKENTYKYDIKKLLFLAFNMYFDLNLNTQSYHRETKKAGIIWVLPLKNSHVKVPCRNKTLSESASVAGESVSIAGESAGVAGGSVNVAGA